MLPGKSGLEDAVIGAVCFVVPVLPGKSGLEDAVIGAVCFVAPVLPGKSGLEDAVTAITLVELALSACVPR